MGKVRYTELFPKEFRARLAEAPIAYLPLGTLEWHGEHLPLGMDGLGSQGIFEALAENVGGIVLPMLFLGPDRMLNDNGTELYGMEFCTEPRDEPEWYPNSRLDGGAYWVPDELFERILSATIKQLHRAGFKIIVAHGHGPSTLAFSRRIEKWEAEFGIKCFHCWFNDGQPEGYGFMVDHAAMNETSLVMSLRPDLVQIKNLPLDLSQWPVGVGGKDPRIHASKEVGDASIQLIIDHMTPILQDAVADLKG